MEREQMTDPWADFKTEQGGGGKGISFGGVGDRSQIGQIKGGRIVAVQPKQEVRDFKTKELKKTKGGRQLYQLPVMVATNERDHTIPEDDGVRVLYIKGLMFDAVDEALKTAGRETIEIGGELLVAYIGDRRVGEGEMRAFKAKYIPGAPQAAAQAEFFGGQQAPPAADPFGTGLPVPPQQGPPPPVDPWANQPAAAAQPQGPPPGWGQQPPPGYQPQGYAPPQQVPAQQPTGDPAWGQPPSTPPAGGGQWPNPGPQQPAGPPPGWGQQPQQTAPPTLADQWAAAGQPEQPANPWG